MTVRLNEHVSLQPIQSCSSILQTFPNSCSFIGTRDVMQKEFLIIATNVFMERCDRKVIARRSVRNTSDSLKTFKNSYWCVCACVYVYMYTCTYVTSST